jgi:hypothetical protein
MDFNYTEEQSLLRDSVAGYLGDRTTSTRARR